MPTPAPETGSQPRAMEKIKINAGPRAKVGNDRPKRLTTPRVRSGQRLTRRAEATPAGMASSVPRSVAATVRARV